MLTRNISVLMTVVLMTCHHSAAIAGPQTLLTIEPTEQQPRNSEGDIVQLKDDRLNRLKISALPKQWLYPPIIDAAAAAPTGIFYGRPFSETTAIYLMAESGACDIDYFELRPLEP